MRPITIGVIVPNRNDSRYLGRCLQSLCEQDIPPDELIVVDDKSTDQSVQVIQEAIDGVPWARLIENPVNLGTNGAVSVGLHLAGCDYILSLSANDYVLPGIFGRAKSCLAKNPGAGIWSAMAINVDEHGNHMNLYPSPVVSLWDKFFSPTQCIHLAYLVGNWFTGPTMIFRRDAFFAAGKFDTAYKGLADWLAGLIIAAREGAAYSPEPLAAVRLHSGGLLSHTLGDNSAVETLLRDLGERGPRNEPSLFSEVFLERFAQRVRFAAIRSGGQVTPGTVAPSTSGLQRRGLNALERLVPRRLHHSRVVLSFLLLRPYDVLPVLWYRCLGWVAIRLRLWLRRSQ
jgi:hypothetical protein